jgi:hypothetical protein
MTVFREEQSQAGTPRAAERASTIAPERPKGEK